MSTKADIIIVGGGFAGIYSAWRLARDGVAVTLIEKSANLGGTLWSQDWRGYRVDTGTHNLDLRTEEGAMFYGDILGSNLKVLEEHEWGSMTGGAVTMGFEMPDFSNSDPALCDSALKELAAIKGAPATDPPTAYADWLTWRYAPSLGARLAEIATKVIGAPIDGIAAEAAGALGMLSRPKLGTDTEMERLKGAEDFYDDRLGVTLASNDPRFMGRSVVRRFGYPAEGALRAFCEAALTRLRELGVVVHVSAEVTSITPTPDRVDVATSAGSVTGRRLFWSLPDQGLLALLGIDLDLRPSMQPVGAAIHAFEVRVDDITGPDYVQDFDTGRLCYRYSRPGVYGGQVTADGQRSVVIAEVPCHPAGAKHAQSPETSERAWADLLGSGYLRPEAERFGQMAWVYPVAYTLPRIGWQALVSETEARIAEISDRIFGIAFGKRGRHAFMTFYETDLQHRLKG